MLAVPRPLTRSDCLQEARPCPWVGCSHHLLLEVTTARATDRRPRGRPTTLRMNAASSTRSVAGRRKGLRSNAAAALVRTWIDAAVEQLSRMRYTCSLDVATAHPDGLLPPDVGRVLGVTKQQAADEVDALTERDDVKAMFEEWESQ